ncbi:hypothetical protein CLIB1423_01S05556 [[Candida] railenensis]|uniref:Uncharacterized protein n=1 Tax=[Candida] railenensis TaxID=45579 RepID=A0A9P0QKK8_9ASCO|nr:hypothetical protein CLIB1423_01S05556 [[Candida] railenensis]
MYAATADYSMRFKRCVTFHLKYKVIRNWYTGVEYFLVILSFSMHRLCTTRHIIFSKFTVHDPLFKYSGGRVISLASFIEADTTVTILLLTVLVTFNITGSNSKSWRFLETINVEVALSIY